MLIGFCGPAGSGKDTASDFLVREDGFVKVALADPLKRICRDVFAFSDEQLYGPSVRRNGPDKRYPRSGHYTYPNAPVGALWYPIGGGRTLIDEGDVPLLSQFTWCVHSKEEGKKTSYVRVAGESKKLHQLLLGPPPEGQIVDHINGDGLDNRRRNLRFCTHTQNRQNQTKRSDGGSPFKGVGWLEDRKKWRAFIKVEGQQKTLGYFDREDEAAQAYDNAARIAFGDFARLNSDLFLTPRHALQQLGTEWGRSCYPNVWVDYALRVATRLLADPIKLTYDAQNGITNLMDVQGLVSSEDWKPTQGVVISDVRFKNEVAAINAAGGVVIRLLRGQGLTGEAGQHRSETEMTEIPDNAFAHVIDNRKTSLAEFEVLVREYVRSSREK